MNTFPEITSELFAKVAEENPHFTGEIYIKEQYTCDENDTEFTQFGFTHWVDFANQGNQYRAIYAYCPVEFTRENIYHKGIFITTRQGWECTAN